MRTARRDFLATAARGFAGLAGGASVAAAGEPAAEGAKPAERGKPAAKGAAMAEDVSATEDLMREHGVLRRILLIYEAALEAALREPPVIATGKRSNSRRP